MAEFKPVPIERWGGLNLRDDPAQVGLGGAIDLVNVDFDEVGRVRTRDGYAQFTAAELSYQASCVFPYYRTTTSAPQILVAGGNHLVALTSAGAVTATYSGTLPTDPFSMVRFGSPTAESVYIAAASWGGVRKWNGSAFSSPAGMPSPAYYVAMQQADNRLAVQGNVATTGGEFSRVNFSDAGDPETFDADNYVDLEPGDGERIYGMASYSGYLIVFKQTKFFVFYGNSTDGTGGAVFNYRAVRSGVGLNVPNGFAVSPRGVYFIARDGIYVTTGGQPQLVSGALNPFFRGSVSSFFEGGTLNSAWGNAGNYPSICWSKGRLYVALPSDAATNDRVFVYDEATDVWTLFDLPANCLAPVRMTANPGDQEEILFGYSTGGLHVGRYSSAYTDDAGTAITSRYRTGFFSPAGATVPSTIREVLMDGTGTVDVKSSDDYGDLDTFESVTLGTSPAIRQGRSGKANYGRSHSYEFSSETGPWALNRATFHVESKAVPGKQP